MQYEHIRYFFSSPFYNWSPSYNILSYKSGLIYSQGPLKTWHLGAHLLLSWQFHVHVSHIDFSISIPHVNYSIYRITLLSCMKYLSATWGRSHGWFVFLITWAWHNGYGIIHANKESYKEYLKNWMDICCTLKAVIETHANKF